MNNLDKRILERDMLKTANEDLSDERSYAVEKIDILENKIILIDKNIDINNDRIDGIDKMFKRLSELSIIYDCNDILNMKVKGCSNIEISKVLGIHRNTVKNRWDKFVKKIEGEIYE